MGFNKMWEVIGTMFGIFAVVLVFHAIGDKLRESGTTERGRAMLKNATKRKEIEKASALIHGGPADAELAAAYERQYRALLEKAAFSGSARAVKKIENDWGWDVRSNSAVPGGYVSAVCESYRRGSTRTSSPSAGQPRREVISEHVRHEVWRRDGGRCVDCGSRDRLEFDHIIPWSKGGSSTARNLELRCEACNRSKGATI